MERGVWVVHDCSSFIHACMQCVLSEEDGKGWQPELQILSIRSAHSNLMTEPGYQKITTTTTIIINERSTDKY